jgi:hypothetical protein
MSFIDRETFEQRFVEFEGVSLENIHGQSVVYSGNIQRKPLPTV